MTDSTQHITNATPAPAEPVGNPPERDARGYVFDIKRYAIHDGPGIRTTVFFKGCPLQCRWCHNPESWRKYPEPGFRLTRCLRCGQCIEACGQNAIALTENGPATDITKCKLCGECVRACLQGAREIIGKQMTVGQVMREIAADVIFYDESGGGVTFSGGEPLMQPQFLLALLSRCRARDIHTAVDTTCYAELEIVREIAPFTDLFLCDIKHMDAAVHKRFTGVDNDRILYNIKELSEAGKKVIIRIPLVPGFNDET
ncbi:MAG: glycyl-radical enzyme activating protein [Sedimentisphaerales bacterium]